MLLNCSWTKTQMSNYCYSMNNRTCCFLNMDYILRKPSRRELSSLRLNLAGIHYEKYNRLNDQKYIGLCLNFCRQDIYLRTIRNLNQETWLMAKIWYWCKMSCVGGTEVVQKNFLKSTACCLLQHQPKSVSELILHTSSPYFSLCNSHWRC